MVVSREIQQPPIVTGVPQSTDREDVARRFGHQLTDAQKRTLKSLPAKGTWLPHLDLNAQMRGRDLVLETLPAWEMTHATITWRRGWSYYRRVHRDGRWCARGYAGHLPEACPQCRRLNEMDQPVGEYRALVAPARLKHSDAAKWVLAQLSESRRRTGPSGSSAGSTAARDAAEPDEYEYWTKEKRVRAKRVEGVLVQAFCGYLADEGRAYRREVDVGAGQCDVFDEARNIVFEAKADASDRFQIRMAIGQLLDYCYFGWESRQAPSPHKALLLRERPPEDILELLGYVDIGVAWAVGKSDFVEEFPWEVG